MPRLFLRTALAVALCLSASAGFAGDIGPVAGLTLTQQRALSGFPGYATGRHYAPLNTPILYGSVATQTAGRILFIPFVSPETVTINAFEARVSAVSAGGNFAWAVYASDPTTKKPTGTALASTGNMSTATATVVSGSIAQQFAAGTLYWLAFNVDNATASFYTQGSTGEQFAQMIGNATGSINNTEVTCYQITQAYGTWPDVTSASFGENGFSVPLVRFVVASSP